MEVGLLSLTLFGEPRKAAMERSEGPNALIRSKKSWGGVTVGHGGSTPITCPPDRVAINLALTPPCPRFARPSFDNPHASCAYYM